MANNLEIVYKKAIGTVCISAAGQIWQVAAGLDVHSAMKLMQAIEEFSENFGTLEMYINKGDEMRATVKAKSLIGDEE